MTRLLHISLTEQSARVLYCKPRNVCWRLFFVIFTIFTIQLLNSPNNHFWNILYTFALGNTRKTQNLIATKVLINKFTNFYSNKHYLVYSISWWSTKAAVTGFPPVHYRYVQSFLHLEEGRRMDSVLSALSWFTLAIVKTAKTQNFKAAKIKSLQ